MYIRSLATYQAFISNRSVDSTLHREDGGVGYVIGIVDKLRSGDESISETEYLAEAELIRSYNAALPLPPPPTPSPSEVFLQELTAATTLAQLKSALIKRFGG